MDIRNKKIISFLSQVDKCKLIERQMYCSDQKRRESDAEHSWHLIMFIILFNEEFSKSLNVLRMIKLAAMHDLVEIYAGDTFIFDKKGVTTKKKRELDAASKLFSKLPNDLEKEFFALFNEYEEQKTPEAKMVKSFDQIQPILQNICSNGKSWKEHGVKVKDINNHKRNNMLHNDFVLEFYEYLLELAKEQKLIK